MLFGSALSTIDISNSVFNQISGFDGPLISYSKPNKQDEGSELLITGTNVNNCKASGTSIIVINSSETIVKFNNSKFINNTGETGGGCLLFNQGLSGGGYGEA